MTADQYRKQIISFRSALILAVFFALTSVAFSILLRGELRTATGDGLAVLVDSLAALALFYAAQRSIIYGRQVRLAWTVLTLGLIIHTLGDILWMITEVILHQSPLFSLADGPFLAQFPIYITGILLLPSISLTSSERLKVMLDEGIVVIASVMIFWVLLIAPTIESNAGTDIGTQILSVAYPVMDLMLLFALIELLFRRIKSKRLGPVLLLIIGTAVMIGTDFLYLSQSLQKTYVSGGLLDTGWIVAYSLVGLAGVLQANSINLRTTSSASTQILSSSSRSLEKNVMQFTVPYYLPYL
jgi:hypothetical protein